MMHFRRGIATFALTVIGFGAGAIFTSGASAQSVAPPPAANARPHHLRGERGSRSNIRMVERRVHRQIVQLQHDQRDYGGHRVTAINFLSQADNELKAAVQYDREHPQK